MIYIPILDTLQCLFQDSGVLAEVRTDTCTCSLSFLCHTVFLYMCLRCIRVFYRSCRVTSHRTQMYCLTTAMVRGARLIRCSLVSSNLQILFYYDDVEPCNTLGSGQAKHKLGELSCTLKNMYCSLSFVHSSQCTVHVHVPFTVSAAVFYFMLGNVKS